MTRMTHSFEECAPDRSLSDRLNRPLAVGNRILSKRLVLAPLSKLGNVAFRELVAGFGGYGLLFSEMAGARAVPNGNGHHKSGFRWRAGELDALVCQIYGDDPGEMAVAARRVETEGFFGVDINFGCSVAAVCNHNCGAALLQNPVLAGQIVSAVRKAVSVPVFVKFRTGWRDDPEAAADFGRRFEEAGADALTFHPRVAPDIRTRPPKWAYIGRVKEAVSIPVFGNGNVFDAAACERMLRTTGCNGVALGRIAAARPWIFAEWTGGFRPDPEIYGRTARNLLELLLKHFEPTVALRRFYKFTPYFAANFRFGHTLYSRVFRAKSVEALQAVLTDFFSTPPDLLGSPNPNLFS